MMEIAEREYSTFGECQEEECGCNDIVIWPGDRPAECFRCHSTDVRILD